MTQNEIDVKNLRLYAQLFREHQWQTRNLHWSVFAATLEMIAERLEVSEAATKWLGAPVHQHTDECYGIVSGHRIPLCDKGD